MAKENTKKVQIEKKYKISDVDFMKEIQGIKEISNAFTLLKKIANGNFDESVECALRVLQKKKKTDKTVRGSLSLPNSVVKTKPKIAVFASGEDVQKAMNAGAAKAGLEDLIEEVMTGNAKYDYYVSSKAVFGQIAKVARVLKGLMPNLKLGTVTDDVQAICKKLMDGIVQYREDKASIVHCKIGYKSFTEEQLTTNFNELVRHLYNNYNNGRTINEFFQSAYICATHSRSISISHQLLSQSIKN